MSVCRECETQFNEMLKFFIDEGLVEFKFEIESEIFDDMKLEDLKR